MRTPPGRYIGKFWWHATAGNMRGTQETHAHRTALHLHSPPAHRALRVAFSADRRAIMTNYLCGDCGVVNEIKPKDPIRCRFCGYRILYKMRTKNRARQSQIYSYPPRHPRASVKQSARCIKRVTHARSHLDIANALCSHPIRGEVTRSASHMRRKRRALTHGLRYGADVTGRLDRAWEPLLLYLCESRGA